MTTTDPTTDQSARGVFAYWSAEAEQQWRAQFPEYPAAETHTPLPVVRDCKYGFPLDVTCRPNYYFAHPTEHDTWEKAVECGKSYLCGDEMPMDKFIITHRSALTAWQKEFFDWCRANPGWCLDLTKNGNEWSVSKRGEYVDFALPHQDAGGEKNYISINGRTKILVNVD